MATPKTRKPLQRPKTTSGALIPKYDLGSRDPDRFIAFFFSTYVFAGRHCDSSCGLFDHASTLYRRASPSSALVQAAVVLGATTFILSRRYDGSSFSWYHEIRLSAIQSMHRDIQSKAGRLRDDTLMAVLLLDMTEAIIRGHMGSSAPLSHQHGALTLLKLRGALNFKTAEAFSLYNAARCATLRGKARSAETASALKALDVLASLKKVDQPPALRLLDTLDKISALQCALETAVSHKQSFDHLYGLALETQMSLDAWETCLPPQWRPQTVAVQAPGQLSTSSQVEVYENMDIASVYNSWRCASLKMTRLSRILSENILPRPQPADDGARPIFEGIRRSVPVFLGWLHGSRYVEQDTATGAWKEPSHLRREADMQRFPGDYLGKWFLSDLLERLEQAIGDDTDLLPKLHVSPETILFLREQKRMLSDLSPSATQQLVRVFPDVRA